jgi:hypothetical protein
MVCQRLGGRKPPANKEEKGREEKERRERDEIPVPPGEPPPAPVEDPPAPLEKAPIDEGPKGPKMYV